MFRAVKKLPQMKELVRGPASPIETDRQTCTHTSGERALRLQYSKNNPKREMQECWESPAGTGGQARSSCTPHSPLGLETCVT